MSALDDLLLRKYKETVVNPPRSLVNQVIADDPISEPAVPSPTEASAQPNGDASRTARSDAADSNEVRPFKPEWEVDAYRWPAVCADCENRVGEHLSQAVERIWQNCVETQTKLVAVVGKQSGTGASSMALCLARESARQGLSVAIMDFNHDNPKLAQTLGIEFEKGIESIHQPELTAESICIKAVDCGVVIFPTTSTVDEAFFTDEHVLSLVQTAAAAHDVVFLDVSREVAGDLSHCDGLGPFGFVLVQDQTRADVSSNEPLPSDRKVNARPIGIIKNFAA